MDIITDPIALQTRCLAWRGQGLRIGLVPTMGYFHRGHLALMDAARERSDALVVSLFVNPTQFGPAEDLAKYPRDLDRDRALAEEHGRHGPVRARARGHVPGRGRHPGGGADPRPRALRPDPPHPFRRGDPGGGQALSPRQPHVAVFGQKDWQQLAIIRRMVRDLFFPVEIMGHEIVREPDGLALSSRNVYMTPEERAQAPGLQRGLTSARALVASGERSAAAVKKHILDFYAAEVPVGQVDYVGSFIPKVSTA